jgi:hypothetical protein
MFLLAGTAAHLLLWQLAAELEDEVAGELRGRLGNAHLAALLAAAVAR